MKKTDFEKFLNSINCCYAKNVQNQLPKITDFPNKIFIKDIIDVDMLSVTVKESSDYYYKSVALRTIAIHELINSRDLGLKVNINKIWNLIRESISIVPTDATISSIGSQGFLSIPLFKDDKVKEEFDFIRLHMWDNTLNQYINKEISEKFSIHTHSFFSKSWIICGQVINDRFDIVVTDEPSEYSLFTVEYNKSLNEINQHSSSAVNTDINIKLNQISHEVHMPGSEYFIKAGDYHRSGTLGIDGLSATFFSFTGKNGIVDQSYVTGPSDVESSEINRKMHIDPEFLLNRIDKII